MGIMNECEKHTVISNVLGKYNGIITYNNTDRGKYSTVVIDSCSNSAPSLTDLLSHKCPWTYGSIFPRLFLSKTGKNSTRLW